jgi:hypothetical protein
MPDYDVIVAGGGSAGIAAAVTAARTGAHTLLVEHAGVLGGQAPLALVHSICGLYHLADDGPPRFANHGFAEEFATRLLAAGGAHGPVRMGRAWVLLTDPAIFARLASDIARETAHLEVRLRSEAQCDADLPSATRDAALAILCRGPSSPRPARVTTRCLIDTTGDAALAAALGAPCEQQDSARLQRPAYIFRLDGVPPAALDDEARLRLAHRIVAAVKDGALPASALGATVRTTAPLAGVFVTIDLHTTADYDPTDADCIAHLNAEGRALSARLTDFLREQVGAFARCRIAEEPARIGIRESRRIVGEYRMEAADLERGATFPDAVALATWPMELRETNRGPRLRYGQPCEVPLRALRFRDHPHCFMAGRCLSASHEAQASLRVIGTALATGEAAGRAAARSSAGIPACGGPAGFQPAHDGRQGCRPDSRRLEACATTPPRAPRSTPERR